jgi:hypothetical protein
MYPNSYFFLYFRWCAAQFLLFDLAIRQPQKGQHQGRDSKEINPDCAVLICTQRGTVCEQIEKYHR